MIRPARPDDVPQIMALMHYNGLAVEEVTYATFTPPCLVDDRNGVLAGFIQAHLGHPYAIVTEIAVAPSMQNKGVAVRLIEHLETVLRCAGMTAWMAYSGNKRESFHEQLERYGARCTGEGRAFVRVL